MERAGHTVTIFVVDVSPSMGNTRVVQVPPGPEGERTRQITNLEWSLQYVLYKIQEMIYNGRKTDQCGVILYGTTETDNCINTANGGYENVTEYIPIAQPTAETIDRVLAIKPSTEEADALDGLIVAIQTQDIYLARKPSWTRKIVLVTDGENSLETTDWEQTAEKLNELDIATTIIGVDFDDDNFTEDDKSPKKRENEVFWKQFEERVVNGLLGSCYLALQDCALPEVKSVKPALRTINFRIGDIEGQVDEAIEISTRVCKVISKVSPPTLKKFVKRGTVQSQPDEEGDEDMGTGRAELYAQLERRTDFVVNLPTDEDEEEPKQEDEEEDGAPKLNQVKVDPEALTKAYKYGASFVHYDGELERLRTLKGIEVTGFINSSQWNRSYEMGEVYCLLADPNSAKAQISLSSFVRAMLDKNVMAVVRWVHDDGADPKMAVCQPIQDASSDYLFMVRVPFAEDVRNYSFPSLDRLHNKHGKPLTNHPHLVSDTMQEAMDKWVDKMDLMEAAVDDEGKPAPWFDAANSYNPAVHRMKQALFHSAIVADLSQDPIPPPHPELTKYLESPEEVVTRSAKAFEKLTQVLDVKIVPPKAASRKKKANAAEATEFIDEDFSLADIYSGAIPASSGSSRIFSVAGSRSQSHSGFPTTEPKDKDQMDIDDGDTEDEADPLPVKPAEPKRNPLPTPGLSPPTASKGKGKEVNTSPSRTSNIKPGRIIGNSRPLYDFRKNLERGDLVSKALEDMGHVIPEIVESSFSSQRYDEAIDCMKAMRSTALEEDDVDIWNSFVQSFKKQCRQKQFKNSDFWSRVQNAGTALSLITAKEADKHETYSEFTERQAEQFIRS